MEDCCRILALLWNVMETILALLDKYQTTFFKFGQVPTFIWCTNIHFCLLLFSMFFLLLKTKKNC